MRPLLLVISSIAQLVKNGRIASKDLAKNVKKLPVPKAETRATLMIKRQCAKPAITVDPAS
jgi:hypothetical protein